MDATRGIATAIFEGTLAGLTERSLTKFQRRMCGSCLAAFQERLSPRPFLEIREELALLGDAFQAGIDVRFCWTKAYVGSRDLIFSPEAQYAAWEQLGVPTEPVDAAHYDTDFLAGLLINDC